MFLLSNPQLLFWFNFASANFSPYSPAWIIPPRFKVNKTIWPGYAASGFFQHCPDSLQMELCTLLGDIMWDIFMVSDILLTKCWKKNVDKTA